MSLHSAIFFKPKINFLISNSKIEKHFSKYYLDFNKSKESSIKTFLFFKTYWILSSTRDAISGGLFKGR